MRVAVRVFNGLWGWWLLLLHDRRRVRELVRLQLHHDAARRLDVGDRNRWWDARGTGRVAVALRARSRGSRALERRGDVRDGGRRHAEPRWLLHDSPPSNG